ncbi:MAG: LLM class F420-dependent oxidoreductase [Chloroflexi bacterium]|nr:LLM class F420-dependent oxidoreductase [Chloroflexota bacterium]
MIPLGISFIPTQQSTDIAVLAKRAEDLGFDSIWVPEQHTLPVKVEKPVPRLWGDIVDPLIALARASAATTTLKLGTAVLVVPARNPITLAKEVATLDMYSGGRFLFGIGVGGLREEGEVLGVDFDHRWTQGKESVEAMKELWIKEESEYHGRYFDFPPVYCFPKPERKPYPPIILGSTAPNAFKRIAAWGDGWLPMDITTEEVAHGRSELDRLAKANGRDPRSIEISVMGVPPDAESIERYTKAGADRIVLGVGGQEDDMESMEEVASKVF